MVIQSAASGSSRSCVATVANCWWQSLFTLLLRVLGRVTMAWFMHDGFLTHTRLCVLHVRRGSAINLALGLPYADAIR